MKKLMSILLVLIMLPTVLATQIPMEYDVNVRFNNVTSFTLFLPYGIERHYTWATTEKHSDDLFKATTFFELNETKYCLDSSTMIQRYEEVISLYGTTTQLCNELLMGFNDSYGFNGEMWGIQQGRIEKFESERNETSAKLDACEEESTTCSANLGATQGKLAELPTCQNNLTDCQAGKTQAYIIGGIVGAIGCFLIMKNKRKPIPLEHQEVGYEGDIVDIERGQMR